MNDFEEPSPSEAGDLAPRRPSNLRPSVSGLTPESTLPRRLAAPVGSWRGTVNALRLLSDQPRLPPVADAPFLRSIGAPGAEKTLGVVRTCLAALGFLTPAGAPTSALRMLVQFETGSSGWRRIVQQQFLRTYRHVFGEEANILFVSRGQARRAIEARGGRSGQGVDHALRFFATAQGYLRGLDHRSGEDGGAGKPTSRGSQMPDASAGTKKPKSVPYVSWPTIRQLLLLLSEEAELPARLTPEVLHEVMPSHLASTHQVHLYALKALGLVDADEAPTPVFRALLKHEHGSEPWREALGKQLESTYFELLDSKDPGGLRDKMLVKRIQNRNRYSLGKAQTAVRFLRGAIQDSRAIFAGPSAKKREYVEISISLPRRKEPVTVRAPRDLREDEARIVDSYLRSWIVGASSTGRGQSNAGEANSRGP